MSMLEAAARALIVELETGDAKCPTCDGHGVVGGFDFAEAGYRTEDCPDCSDKTGERE